MISFYLEYDEPYYFIVCSLVTVITLLFLQSSSNWTV